MKIRKLEIQNYKIFDDVSFDFTDQEGKTLSTIVLAGMNGCGKTTVLELIKDFFRKNLNLNPKAKIRIEIELTSGERSVIPIIHAGWHGDQQLRTDLFAELKTSPVIKLQNIAEIQLFSEYFSSLHELVVIYFPTNVGNQFTNLESTSNVKILSVDHLKEDMKKNALKSIRDKILKNRDLAPRESIEEHISIITKSLSNLGLNTRLVDLESEELIFESANGQRIYFEQLSHGEQHLYFRAIYLSQLNLQNAVIMIDEPEAAFHPTWQQKVAELYSNIGDNNQVFLATHSPHVMASVPPESLFVLNVDETTKKITAINMDKAGKHSQGLEPNRILMEIMQVNSLRDYQTQMDINRLTALLTPEKFESKEAQSLIEKLSDQLGRQDPFIIRLEHQLLILNRKKQSLSPVA